MNRLITFYSCITFNFYIAMKCSFVKFRIILKVFYFIINGLYNIFDRRLILLGPNLTSICNNTLC
uniref:Uncharacterized protein n=1 Tax=virus sp. ctBM815 TaxID=2825806 RepID=A0A8S5RLA1_9VIRU|nr:MAG TPA: hypothetical protein [virus sp. ctBM815]